MFRLLFKNPIALFSKFNTDKFTPQDFKTMCLLLKEKYPVYNEALETKKDIKLIDEKGKLIGRYEASQARKKALNLKKDIVLVNDKSTPMICRLIQFRENTLSNFYNEIVVKKNQQLIKKASSTKNLKISLKLTENDLIIKTKQIIELAKKNLNVRIFINCKQSQVQEAYQKIENLKANIQNKCIIEKDIFMNRSEDDDQLESDTPGEQRKTVSIIIKSKLNEFMEVISENSNKDKEFIISNFLKRYYKQDDVDMMDLKAKSHSEQSTAIQEQFQVEKTEKKQDIVQKEQSEKQQKQLIKKRLQLIAQLKKKGLDNPIGIKTHYNILQEAQKLILTQRLKRILEVGLK